MDPHDASALREQRARRRRRRIRRERFGAFASLVLAVAVVGAIVVGSRGGSGSHAGKASAKAAAGSVKTTTSASAASGTPSTTSVPILAYRVINVAPPSSAVASDLYVPASQFSAQMDALKSAGWHAVTLNQLEAYWTHGTPLGSGKPIVITFDIGYASHYTNALPVLKRLGWVGVENLQVHGLSPTDGGLSDTQIRGLIAAGWELDTAGLSQPDLTPLGPSQVTNEVTSARQTLHSRYGVPVNWFAYPSGHYNASVISAVRTAGFVGATTLSVGWASLAGNRFTLPRLQVVSGTSPSQLLSQIGSAKGRT